MGQNDIRSRRLWMSGLCALVLAGGMAGIAKGQTYVVDTGPGAAQGGLSLTRNQYLAGQFTLDLGHEIPVYGGTPYWLAFEVPTDNFGSGAMPPTPLQELDLYTIDSTAGYTSNTTARIGIRVLPEPDSATMLACGVAALACASSSSGARPRRARSGR